MKKPHPAIFGGWGRHGSDIIYRLTVRHHRQPQPVIAPDAIQRPRIFSRKANAQDDSVPSSSLYLICDAKFIILKYNWTSRQEKVVITACQQPTAGLLSSRLPQHQLDRHPGEEEEQQMTTSLTKPMPL